MGRRLGRTQKVLPWALGDWIFHGEEAYGSKYDEMVELTGLEYGTLANYRYVAGRFQISRRRENVSFAHHMAVASIPLDEVQDALLDRAAAEGLPEKELRDLARMERERLLGDVEPNEESQPDESEKERPFESASLMSLQEAMKNMVTFDVVRAVQAHAASEDVQPLDQWRYQLQRIQESAPVTESA
jgi:hypothetical protein